jgi:hypothetical protein
LLNKPDGLYFPTEGARVRTRIVLALFAASLPLGACSAAPQPTPSPSAADYWNLVVEPRLFNGSPFTIKPQVPRMTTIQITIDQKPVTERNFLRLTSTKLPADYTFVKGDIRGPLPFHLSIKLGSRGPHAITLQATQTSGPDSPALGCSLRIDDFQLANKTTQERSVFCGAVWTSRTLSSPAA